MVLEFLAKQSFIDKSMKTGLYFSFSDIFFQFEGYLGHN